MTKRINISVSDIVYEKIKGISEETGIPYSSLCNMAIVQYIDQKEALTAMNNLKVVFDQMAILKNAKPEEVTKADFNILKAIQDNLSGK